MKLKNIFKFLTFAFLAIQLGSCTDTDAEQKFDDTPTGRLNAQKKELNDLLLTSEHGWKAVYFTDNTQLGGFTHLFKFTNDGKVEMASDFDETTTESYISDYSVELSSTVSLLFTTKNRIHLLSDSNNSPTEDLRGKGYKGDFQFLYYGQENGEIIFKTNRTFQELRFIKATAEDWTDLPKNLEMEQKVIGDVARPLFGVLETKDGTTTHQFDFAFADVTRFATANSVETGSSVTNNMGIAYTPTGIVVSPAVEVGNQKLTNFVYDEVTDSFKATGTSGVSATIKYTNQPLVLTDDYKFSLPGQPYSRLGYYVGDYTEDAPTNSLLFKNELAKVNASLPPGVTISSVQLYFNHAIGTFIYYTFIGRSALQHHVNIVEDPIGKKIILKHKSWNGNTTAATPAFLKDFDKYFMDANGIYVKKENFKLYYTNDVYTVTGSSSSFRISTWRLN